MASRRDLPFLLQLLDDETPQVRSQISEALKSFGPNLKKFVEPLMGNLSPMQQERLQEIIAPLPDFEHQPSSLLWLDAAEADRLEKGLISLNQLYLEGQEECCVSELMDDLADQFRYQFPEGTGADLVSFVFQDLGIRAIDSFWQDPGRHQVGHLLETRVGSSLIVCSLITLLARRANLTLYTIKLQGHFMIMKVGNGGVKIFNPIQKGAVLPRSSAIYLEEYSRRNLTWPSQMQVKAAEVVIHILMECVQDLKRHGRQDQADRYLEYQELLFQEIKRRGDIG